MFFDLPLEHLKPTPPSPRSPDFDNFWQDTLSHNRSFPLNARFEAAEHPLKLFDIFDVSFAGYSGQEVKAWLKMPKGASELPCIVEYIGYGGGRSLPIDRLLWASAGYAHLLMDTRGQGSAWSAGDTPDPEPEGSSPHHPGFMTKGILNPKSYYYRRVFSDAVRAVETARNHPRIDPNKIIVTGGSQGGGIALAVSGLVPDLLATMPDVPFLCHYRSATEITNSNPYYEIVRYLQVHRDKTEQVFHTLSYFDGLNFAARATCQGLFSTALMDDICPPRTVYAAYNHFTGPKDLKLYPYNQHEGGGIHHDLEKLKFVAKLLA
ncbi:MAG: acetylxylan esterase [Deinococcales bacterium]